MFERNVVKRAFDEIFNERVHQVAYKKCTDDPEHYEAKIKATGLFKLLMDSLESEKQQDLLRDLECEWNLSGSVFLEYAYRQGLEDSQMIHNELSKYGISVAKDGVNNE